MPPDQLHHKREAREREHLQRKAKEQSVYKRALVVVEGQTEEKYLNTIKQMLRLSSVEVEVSSGSAPISVVECALERFAEEGRDFDFVFCVFDHDNQPTYDAAITKAQDHHRLPKEGDEEALLYAIPSIPCFEFWLLLHFRNTSRQYTSCDEVTRDLQQELKKAGLPAYKKPGKFQWLTEARFESACTNARQVEQQAGSGGFPVPTWMHVLVEKLKSLR